MMVWPGLLYTGADQDNNRSVNTLAIAQAPNETEVPDPAVTPSTKIILQGTANWLSTSSPPAAATFSDIQMPAALQDPACIWANFKNDTFCFVDQPEVSKPGDILQYFGAVTSMAWPHPGQGGRLRSHWFSHIQNIAFIVPHTGKLLGYRDRAALADLPNLRSVTYVAELAPFICRHIGAHLQVCTTPAAWGAEIIERLSLETFLVLREELAAPCGCDYINARLDELEKLERDRPNGFPSVDVKVELEAYWFERPDIEEIVAIHGDPENDAFALCMAIFASWTGDQQT